ncbi:VirB3 family type IV secretion system protein [Roseobacter sp. HKCCA0434]|uniref:VirB3 family type IV secretion system protein n=1 Tax=Roseobacter sp. HKCCA0434 TaxID=3079297 RepID=UPI002905C16E|nr:VirB3 family type IV secretion system protein [Roseobacter sp. HKCCA0434]
MAEIPRNHLAHSLTKARTMQGMEPLPFIILLMVCGLGIYLTFVRAWFGYLPILGFAALLVTGMGALRRLADHDPMFFQLLVERLKGADAFAPYDPDISEGKRR